MLILEFEEQLEDPNFKYKKFSELFKEESQYDATMKYLRQKSLIDDSGKWKGTDKKLVQILKTIHHNGRFKKDIPKSTTVIQFISKKFFLTPVDINTVKRNHAFKSGIVFDSL